VRAARDLATTIGARCRIIDSAIGVRCEIRESVVASTRIGDDVRIGPFAHLRDGNVIGDRVRIGNFVDIKKSEIADDVKANHLAYIGDSSVGQRTNYGAGAITCNYDGVTKNRTEIGADVFSGSTNSLVAPLSVGEYVHRQLPDSELVLLRATGHCPNLSAPDEVISAMRALV